MARGNTRRARGSPTVYPSARTSVMMRSGRTRVCLAAIAALACRERSTPERRPAPERVAQRLVGMWDIVYTLDHPTLLSGRRSVTDRVVRGRIAFLANRWLDATYTDIGTPTNYGTYDVDFTPFGFHHSDGQPPTAVAAAFGADSVEVLLGP